MNRIYLLKGESLSSLQRILIALYDFLDVGTTRQKVDCIFVFAGRPERKTYALQLFREGYAKRIIISVGRFEWRRFLKLGFDDDGGLAELVEKTPAPRRHFFVYMDQTETKAFLINKRKFGTLSEAIALSHFIERLAITSLMIISNGFHLRRASRVLRNCRADSKITLIPVAVLDELASVMRKNWWKTSKGFSLIFNEYLKNILYSVILTPFCKFVVKFHVRHLRQI